jgi:hypothetical protein
MAFTANIQAISLVNDKFVVSVLFSDSVTNWNCTKVYNFSSDVDQAGAVTTIRADGQVLKDNLTKNTTLQSKVGTILTI